MKLIYLFNMSSSIGKLFRLTTFGESHGASMGGVIDGCPSGFVIDLDKIQNFLNFYSALTHKRCLRRSTTKEPPR